MIFPKSIKANCDSNVELKTDDDILGALHQALERAKSILLVLGVPISEGSFEFKSRAGPGSKVEKEDIEFDMAVENDDEMLQENLSNEESSLADVDFEQPDPPMNDLAIVRKYCGNYIEKCTSTDGNVI